MASGKGQETRGKADNGKRQSGRGEREKGKEKGERRNEKRETRNEKRETSCLLIQPSCPRPKAPLISNSGRLLDENQQQKLSANRVVVICYIDDRLAAELSSCQN